MSEYDVVVVAVLFAFHHAKVKTDQGWVYSIGDHTDGVDWRTLHEGEELHIWVSSGITRVLRAERKHAKNQRAGAPDSN